MKERVPDWVVVAKVHGEGVGSLLPGAAFGSWDFAVPLHHVEGGVCILCGFGDEAKGMVASPLLSFLLEPVDDHLVDFFSFVFVHWMLLRLSLCYFGFCRVIENQYELYINGTDFDLKEVN